MACLLFENNRLTFHMKISMNSKIDKGLKILLVFGQYKMYFNETKQYKERTYQMLCRAVKNVESNVQIK